MANIMPEDIHDEIVEWGIKEEHDERFPNCKCLEGENDE